MPFKKIHEMELVKTIERTIFKAHPETYDFYIVPPFELEMINLVYWELNDLG